MGVVLRRFKLLCEPGLLIAALLFRDVARTRIVLNLGLSRSHFVDFRGLSGELQPKIRDQSVASRDLGTRDLEVVTGIAQLFFKGGLSRTSFLLAW